ncbi:Coenzyme F420 hydrogenase/dehydrogenase, beta subunit C-terminal domain [Deltaproteobacteria bacterium IMCC39524]|nr:Coenzyme F420 hydrogenase/dehydrogenase, beta subunit C-terminal domain [Deltaproteobacteria bacterium IMCC39524]
MSLRKIKSFQAVAEYQLCCGCGVCGYLNPSKYKIQDVPRFGKRPVVNPGLEGNDDTLEAICPGTSVCHEQSSLNQADLIEELKAGWGPILEIWEVSSTDPEIRFKGSSGGAISALALYCLEREGMSGALQVTSDSEKPYLNRNVLSRSREEILAAVGSRYSPASPCEDLGLIENAKSPCVFIGKPCDVLGANNAAKLKPELEEKLGLTIACFCAGTPSTEGTLQMLSKMGVKNPATIRSLKYRGHGWPGRASVEYDDGQTVKLSELTYEEAWGDLLQKHRQWRCYICPDHTGEFADIAVGDPWYREIRQGEEGISLVLARSQKGADIIQKAIAEGYLNAEKVAYSILPASQPNLLNARGSLWGRLISLKLMGAPCPIYINVPLFPFWLSELDLVEKAKSILSTIKRVFTKDLLKRHQPLDGPKGNS